MYKKRHSLVFPGLFLALTLVIIACSPNNAELIPIPIETPVPEETIALFSDTDLDKAQEVTDNEVEVIATNEVTVPDGQELDLSASQSDFSTQAVLAGASGLIAYIKHNPAVVNGWRIFLFDQASNVKTLVYSGKRELQSVASDAAGTTVVFVGRRNPNNPSSNFEVYKLDISSGVATRMTGTLGFDESDVSLTADAAVAAWESERAGNRAIRWRNFGAGTTTVLVSNRDDVMPSIAGKYIAFIRLLANGNERVQLYNISSGSLTNVFTNGLAKQHPSPSIDGSKVAWTETLLSGTDRVRIKDLSVPSTSTILGNPNGIEHAHMTSNGLYLTYGRPIAGDWHLFTREIATGAVARGTFGPGKDHLGMFWQISDVCIFDISTFDSCAFGP